MDACTSKRKTATTKAMSNVYKLLANSVYGKFIESSAKRMNCKFNKTGEAAIQSASSHLFKGFLICSDDLSISFMKKKEINVKQPTLVGFAVLELSKLIMQRLYYNEIRPRLEGKVQMLMTDTDSFLMVVEKSSPNDVVRIMSDLMDCSNYKPDHPLYDVSRKFQVGYLKNEVPHSAISKFVGLRSKTYIFTTVQEEIEARAKGVTQAAKRTITFDNYYECITDIRQFSVYQTSIQCKNHIARLVQGEKVAFSSFDDKRYLLCNVHSVPYGSALIEESQYLPNKCYFCTHPDLLA
jgi:hypothetical protein